MIPNRKCIVCGKEYYYCPHCQSSSQNPSWMFIYDCENCKNIYNAVSNYKAGRMGAEEAKAILDTCDLSGRKSYKQNIQNGINIISSAVRTLNRKKHATEEPHIKVCLDDKNLEDADDNIVAENLEDADDDVVIENLEDADDDIKEE